MEIMFSNILKVGQKMKIKLHKSKKSIQRIIYGLPISFLVMIPSAFAQSVEGLCTIATWYKTFAGAAALIAILFYVLSSYFGKSSLIESIILNVLIACAVAIGAGSLVNATGLSAQCTI